MVPRSDLAVVTVSAPAALFAGVPYPYAPPADAFEPDAPVPPPLAPLLVAPPQADAATATASNTPANADLAILFIFGLLSLWGETQARPVLRLLSERTTQPGAARVAVPAALHEGVTQASAGLCGHRPHGDEVDQEHDHGEHPCRARQDARAFGAPVRAGEPPGSDPRQDHGSEQEKAAEVRREVADTQPTGLVVDLVPPFLRIDPLRADPHGEPGGDPDEEGRAEGESHIPGRVAAPAEKLGADRRDESPDEDRRTEYVEKERDVPAVGTDGGKHRHAPGLKIMSTRKASRITTAAICRRRPALLRTRAWSSALGASPSTASWRARSRATL